MMNYKILKAACYTSNISMSVLGNLSPLLFLTFRSLYGISYSLLGLLVLINFFTQLLVDLIFSFFSHKFNIAKTVKFTPVLTIIGLLVYAIWPYFMPNHVYMGLVIGTLLFAAAGGLGEVLISPVIAAIPAKDPDREMSKLHSVYAWGVVFVVLFITLFLFLFGQENWQIMALIFSIVPITSIVLFSFSEIPEMQTPEKISGALSFAKTKGVWLCFLAIFFGGAAECTMAQWCSSYIELAFGIPKIWGDIAGVALFSAMLGLGRSLYAKKGKNIENVLFLGSLGAALCYLTATVFSIPIIGLLACGLTGLCVSMLWPGNLIVASDRFPSGGVMLFALMAAGGDLGASVGPQLIGIITDFCIENQTLSQLAVNMQITPEQFGIRAGMFVGMLFPIAALPILAYFKKTKKV